MLRGARLRAALEQRLGELSAREDELRRSRERLVDAQDEARRRLERDIHDGAQQHLVALAVNLRLAATLAATAPDRAEALLAAQEGAAADAVATLLQLSRGIYPPRLEEAGVAAALRAAAGRAASWWWRDGAARYPLDIEAAAYFCCLEAVQNATKHAGAATVRVEVDAGPDALVLTVVDDGVGFDPARRPRTAPGWPTCATGWTPREARWSSASAPGQGTRLGVSVLPARGARCARGRWLRCCPGWPGRWPCSPSLLVTVDVWVAAQAVSLISETAVAVHGFPFVHGASRRAQPLMGALIISRYERHPIGWLLSAIGVLTAVSLLAEAWAFWVLEQDGPGTQAQGSVAAWLSQLLRRPDLDRPDRADVPAGPGRSVRVADLALRRAGARDRRGALPGRHPVRRPDAVRPDQRRRPVRAGPRGRPEHRVPADQPRRGPVALVSMVLRLRGSTGEERQQLRLIALAAGLAAAGLVILFVGQAVSGGEQTWVSGSRSSSPSS